MQCKLRQGRKRQGKVIRAICGEMALEKIRQGKVNINKKMKGDEIKYGKVKLRSKVR